MTKEYENTLRRIISAVIGSTDQTQYGVSLDRIEKWKEKREVESRKYKGTTIEKRLLYYSDFYDLKKIVQQNWEQLKPILIDKKKFEVFFDEVEKFRNTTAHGRELFIYQQNLLNGITQDLKSHYIIFHNKNMKADDFFIRVINISDSLGNRNDNDAFYSQSTNTVLRVGDTIQFHIEAFDPKGRQIHYILSTKNLIVKSDKPFFTVTITEDMIGKYVAFMLEAKTKNSGYENSDFAQLTYAILP